MRRAVFAALAIVFSAESVAGTAEAQKAFEPRAIVQAAAEELQRLKTAAFQHRLEMNYESQGYRATIEAKGYVEFHARNPLGIRYRFENDGAVHVYNGSEAFVYDKREDTIDLTGAPTATDLPARFFQGSWFALSRALPLLLQDPNVEWERVEAALPDRVSVETVLMKRTLASDGSLFEIERDLAIRYRFDFDAETRLPLQVTKLDPNGDFMRTSFSQIDVAPAPAPEEFWYFSTWTTESTRAASDESRKQPLAIGASAPSWSLARFGENPSARPAGPARAVLIEFWISHCGYCIQAVPKINALQEELAQQGIATVSINALDAPETIERFVQANRPAYPIYMGGQDVADAFGVPGYPTVFLLDRNGTVAYSGGIDERAIRAAAARIAREH